MNLASKALPNPSDHLVSAYPFTRKTATFLGGVGLVDIALATYAILDSPPSPWLKYGHAGLIWVFLLGGLGLTIVCTVLAIHGRKRINDRVGLFVFGIWVFPLVGVLIALLLAASRAKRSTSATFP